MTGILLLIKSCALLRFLKFTSSPALFISDSICGRIALNSLNEISYPLLAGLVLTAFSALYIEAASSSADCTCCTVSSSTLIPAPLNLCFNSLAAPAPATLSIASELTPVPYAT